MKRSNLSLMVAAACAGVFSMTAGAAGRSDLVLQALSQGKSHVSGELLVQFSAQSGTADRNAVRQALGVTQREVVRSKNGASLELLKLPLGTQVADAVRGLDGVAGVDFVEPNWIYQHSAVSNDPQFTGGSLWGMYGSGTSPANQYGSAAATAWAANHTNCSNVVIGIIDEGYMYSHEDLAANAFKNPGEIAGNGRDDDGNGYVDDIYGWDFDGNNAEVFDGTGDDHGSHVAGTIGGVGGNGKGVAGVCWNVKMMNAKFLGGQGGTTANAILAVDYFTDLKTRHGLNLVATNNSWGGGGFSQGLKDAIDRANAAGILFVAAAGNSGANNDVTASYPSNYDSANVIAVAALASNGTLASYSQYGATTVDIGAPGSAIMSTVPVRSKGKTVSGYASYSGTSMATPHVTGAVALYAAYHPGSTAAQIKSAIYAAGVATTSLTGKTVTGKRLNVSTF